MEDTRELDQKGLGEGQSALGARSFTRFSSSGKSAIASSRISSASSISLCTAEIPDQRGKVLSQTGLEIGLQFAGSLFNLGNLK